MGEREPGVRESFQGSTPRTPEGEDIAEGTPSEREPRCPAPPEGKPHSLAPSLVEKGIKSLSEYRSGCYPAESPRAIQSELTPDQRNRCCIAGSDGRHFVDRHRENLISRMYAVDGVLDGLLQENLLNDEQYDRVRCQSTSQDKMRELYSYIRGWGNNHKDRLYEILLNRNRPLIQDLLRQGV